jgi:hypothetical protein
MRISNASRAAPNDYQQRDRDARAQLASSKSDGFFFIVLGAPSVNIAA